MIRKDILIIGGGAAGFFAAINAAEINPHLKITILERGNEVLNKVRISGGGRCNVTHAEYLPQELIKNYPRGEKELRGPFHAFMTGDIIAWFEERGVKLKTEDDGRIFPESNSSQTIIDCFLREIKRLKIEVLKKQPVKEIIQKGENWQVETPHDFFSASKILIATGSNPKIWKILEKFGHTVVPGVPSLFTFNIKDQRIKDLPGVATEASVKLKGSKLKTSGPLLITHWGMSGPAILKLSAWGARELADLPQFKIEVNWLGSGSSEEILEELKQLKQEYSKQLIFKKNPFDLPRRLWQNLVAAANIPADLRWADANKDQLTALSFQLTRAVFEVSGKSTFKEEFVTAGGVDLREINFKRFESRICKDLFLAGEVLNIDAITGGFNFQNAWTGGFIAAKALTEQYKQLQN